MSYELGDLNTDVTSACCAAPVTETGFCSSCWEHA